MLRYLTAGESHGPQLTAVIDGLPAGLTVSIDKINHQLARRQTGYGRGGRMDIERDQARILSGVRGGLTLGGPITLVIANRDWENWSRIMDPLQPVPDELDSGERRPAGETSRPRPGHADLPGGIKWNHHDLRNVLERASARETAARVAIGSLARQLLEQFDIRFASHVVAIGGASVAKQYDVTDLDQITELAEASKVRCIDKAAESAMVAEIDAAAKDGDSVGGVVELIVRGIPVGLGGMSQWDQRLDGRLAGTLMSIPSVKAVEIGLGFEASGRRGSQVHDPIYYDARSYPTRKGFHRTSNHAGGLEGGITNGEDVVVRIAAKPISTLNRPLDSVDVKSKDPVQAMVERADHCVVPALAVIAEAAAALVLADAFLEKFGSDNLAETRRNYDSFLAAEY
ncbi:MAG TPA: chorismate synthase [Acidobacteriota bacterium]|nr:chorismate synthase [Acidobacteriota bacterium]